MNEEEYNNKIASYHFFKMIQRLGLIKVLGIDEHDKFSVKYGRK